MQRETSAPPGPAVALWSTVRTDFLVQLVWLLFAFTAALYLLPVLGEAQRAFLSRAMGPFVFLALTVVALRRGLGQLNADERRFWNDVSAAFACWLAVAALYLAFPQVAKPVALDLVVETFYAAYYVAFVLAAERQPHRAHQWRVTGLERALAWPAVTAFVLGMFGYFIVIPTLAGPAGADRSISSYALYLALDAYLTGRFLVLAATARAPRWRMLYLILGVTAGIVFLNDLLEALVYAGAPLQWGAPLDLAYYLPYLAIVLARARHFPLPRTKAATGDGEDLPAGPFSGPSARTMVHALAFPLLHAGCYLFGLLDPALEPARQALVFWVLLVLAAIALIQQRLWARKIRQLWLDRRKVESSLRQSEKDLRVMVERYHAEEKLRVAEEKFASALRASGDVIALSSMTDGRIADVNASFERVTGYSREELVGRTVAEIDLWADPEQRRILIRRLQQEGAVRDLEADFRTKGGGLVTGLLSAERLTLDGEPYLLSVTHVISEGPPAQAGDEPAGDSGPPAAE